MTKHELAELVRLAVKAMRRTLEQRDAEWICQTRERADMFMAMMR